MPASVELRDICKSISGQTILDHADFSAEKGTIHGLVGKNGAGKSTLMKVLFGAVPKDAGVILVNGFPCEINNVAQARALGISMVFQELSLFPKMTVAENIFIGRLPVKRSLAPLVDTAALMRQADELLSQLRFPLDPGARVGGLSLGNQQMVEIARALSQQAQTLILDEPTAALTEPEAERLFAHLRALKALGVTIIFISHRLAEVAALCDNLTIMRDGKTVATIPAREIESQQAIRLMVGEELSRRYPRLPVQPGAEVFRLEGLSKGELLKNVSFALHEGEILGIAGLAGSGRSVLANSIFGAEKPTSGRIFLRGREARISGPADTVRHGLAYVTEDRENAGMFMGLGAAENITAPNLARVARSGLIKPRLEESTALSYARRLGFTLRHPRQRGATLSGGNQQKIVFGRGLYCGGLIYILDEPTRGLDIPAKVDVYNIINSLVRGGAGVILISSDLPELIGMCHRVLVMFRGAIVGELSGSSLTEEMVVRLASGRLP
ncbi:MAG: sugar ABC transporter ATP-binding protein [Bacteroidota bacterium]